MGTAGSRLSLGRPTAQQAFLALAAAAIAAYFALPAGGLAQACAAIGLLWATIALAAVRAVRERQRDLAILAAGAAMYGAGFAVWYLVPLLPGQSLPYPSINDLVFFAAYGFYALFLLRMILAPATRRGLAAAGPALDAAVVAAAGGVLIQRVLIEPILAAEVPLDAVVVTTLAYDVALLVLGALTAQFVLVRGIHSRADALIVLWIGGEVLATSVWGWTVLEGTFVFGHPVFLAWMVSYTGLGLFTLETRSIKDVDVHTVARRVAPARRLAVLGAATMVTIAALITASNERFHATYEAWAIATVVLVLLRAFLLMREVESERDLRRRVEQLAIELEHGATHDPLTGLLNRAALTEALRRARARRARGVPVALLVLDLDGFKAVNDTLGHGIGDDALREVARRLGLTARESDAVARLGGDEFAIVAEDVSIPEALALADRVITAVANPILEIPGEPGLSLSVGIYPLEVDDTETSALRFADAAMYTAKASGGGLALFDRETHSRFLERHELTLQLRGAAAAEQLVLHYQPIVETLHRTTRSAEALVRWRHPTRGLLAPAQFIDLAESTGTIVDVGRWVLAQACRDAAAWQIGVPHWAGVSVSVNVSRRQLRAPSIREDVASALDASGLPPDLLTIEVTESALVSDTDEMIRVIERIKDLGVQIAMDDFGTGYSSLAQLRQLPVDILKIDKSFVAGIAREDEEWALTSAIVKLATSLGRTTLAEGVERASQLAHLRALGVELAQGYLFARPAPLDELFRAKAQASGTP